MGGFMKYGVEMASVAMIYSTYKVPERLVQAFKS
jgi:hypothetical protein